MTHGQAPTTRRLLRQLATPPAASAGSRVRKDIAGLIDEIRTLLLADEDSDALSISASTLHQWRTRLDQALHAFEAADPDAWARVRQPGTWLDNHLRLRSLLAHEVAKAYWDNTTHIEYASIDIERYLWGAR
ncbi:hypothetical protein ABT369_26470 [Dactylosporangium sp. NPDC000244]|uniref:hypothetical protein n=1 Tax=Dactylosporangium sp. NPDC000244 TaxID=3154365 RepID=UPI00331C5C8C